MLRLGNSYLQPVVGARRRHIKMPARFWGNEPLMPNYALTLKLTMLASLHEAIRGLRQ
jgi:hypothetical protein